MSETAPPPSTLWGRLAVFCLVATLSAFVVFTLYFSSIMIGVAMDQSTRVDALQNRIDDLEREATHLRVENASLKDSDRHIAVSLKENKLFLMQGDDVMREIKVATGSGKKIWHKGKVFEFKTPPKAYTILKKDTDPIWYAPDWHWIERGETVPENLTMEQRGFKGVMGKYALRLGDGYAIHGTNQPWSIGQYATHGCVRVGAKDLEILFKAVDTGTRVYIY